MIKKKQIQQPPHVLIFVEGDTDEVFFKALINYYASVSSSPLLPYDICNLKGVTRYSSKLLAKLKKSLKLMKSAAHMIQMSLRSSNHRLSNGMPLARALSEWVLTSLSA